MKRKIAYVTLAVLVLAATAGITFYTEQSFVPEYQEPKETSAVETITLKIEGAPEHTSVSIRSGQTMLGVLKALNAKDRDLKLATKEYTGLGILIESMYGKKNGTDGKYWQYRVNGVMPQIGADKYILKPGDSAEWFFEDSQE